MPSIESAAVELRSADALVFTAGAGMGVDSGLPDFRGDEGFWRAYPAYRGLGLAFEDLANPRWFDRDPALAWGFYGHRMNLYRATVPHAGFAILNRWNAAAKLGGFVFTSNVDGQFQRAGFAEDRVMECHGAIDWLQCTRECGAGIFSASGLEVAVDARTFRARDPLPKCPRCAALARPNILMFGDSDWDAGRASEQQSRLESWLSDGVSTRARVVVVECGAGTAVPTVRAFGERLVASGRAAMLVRINKRESEVPSRSAVGIALGALEALQRLAVLVAP